MQIRSATIEDAAAISEGEYAAAAVPGLLNALPGEIPQSAFTSKIQSLSGHARGLYIVAVEDGEVIGHVLLDPMPLVSNNHVCALTIVVYPKRQGRGVGRNLMQHALGSAKRASGVEKLELGVRASNEPALRLYRSMGFEEEGRLRKRVKAGDAYHDDIAMSLFV